MQANEARASERVYAVMALLLVTFLSFILELTDAAAAEEGEV